MDIARTFIEYGQDLNRLYCRSHHHHHKRWKFLWNFPPNNIPPNVIFFPRILFLKCFFFSWTSWLHLTIVVFVKEKCFSRIWRNSFHKILLYPLCQKSCENDLDKKNKNKNLLPLCRKILLSADGADFPFRKLGNHQKVKDTNLPIPC